MNESVNHISSIELTDFPGSDDIVVRLNDYNFLSTLKRINEACLQASQNDFHSRFNNSLTKFSSSTTFANLHGEGYLSKILFPGKPWFSGKLRVRLVVEFLPDEPVDVLQGHSSPLDDLRQDS
ncbi:MAG: hypothetical protein OHK0012_23430 [Synechococcales cyanobacterium]